MTLLEIFQRACKEAGLTGSPTTVVGVTGMQSRMLYWVQDALRDIESRSPQFGWMWLPFSFATVSGQSEYTPLQAGITADTFGEWYPYEMRNYQTSVGLNSEIFMDQIDFDTWRDAYLYGATRDVRSRPLQFAVSPTEALCVGPVPDGTYTISGFYYRSPQEFDLTNDADTPQMPLEFQMSIVWRALIYYGTYMAASEAIQRGEVNYKGIMRTAINKRTPTIGF